MKSVRSIEQKLATFMNKLADFIGQPRVFLIAFVLTSCWFLGRLFLEYDIWYDIMDVTIFLFTFFMLFVVQSSQNADTKAIQDKLDELIYAIPQADTSKQKEEEEFKKGADL